MSTSDAPGKQSADRFGDNLLRIRIVCNSLRAFAEDGISAAGAAAEAKPLVRFLEDELPVLVQQNEGVLTAAIRSRSKGDYAARATTEIMREDHERLIALGDKVIQGLRSVARPRGRADREAVRQAILSYLAAQRSYMEWSTKIISEADSADGGTP